MIRLGDGTEESHRRAQDAVDALWPYTGEMFERGGSRLPGVAVDPADLRAAWRATVADMLAQATLQLPGGTWMQRGGRVGRHSEHLGHHAGGDAAPAAHPPRRAW